MSLEKNIERIADALEVIAKTMGAKAPSEDKNTLVQQAGQQIPVQPPAQGNWQGPGVGNGQAPQMQQPVSQGGPVPVSLPAGMGTQWQGAGNSTVMPGAQFQQPAGSGTVPTTAAAQQYTFDQLAVATANLASAGKDVFSVLARFGVNMLMDLPPEKYGEYAAALREAGGVI